MKKFFVTLLMGLSICAGVQAEDNLLQFGITGGVNITKADGKGEGIQGTGWNFDSETGYCVGVMAKVELPLLGWGVDASLLYSQEVATITDGSLNMTDKLRYFTIPLHLRYGLELPGLEKLIQPFAFAGPQCSFALNEFNWYEMLSQYPNKEELLKDISSYNSTEHQTWKFDLGFGAILGNKIQVAYTYCIPLTTAFSVRSFDEAQGTAKNASDNFKLGCHRIGLTYFF